MPERRGTSQSTGLLHLPNIEAPKGVTYLQVGGFGPVSREKAMAAAKQAALVGRVQPSKVWVQRPSDPKELDPTLKKIIEYLERDHIRYDVINKDSDARAGFGVYYLYGDKVIMEHTSDPESQVLINGKSTLLPHMHVEVVDYADVSLGTVPMNDRIKAINKFKIFDDSPKKTGGQPKVERLVRLGQADPSSKETKPKFNHHIYYRLP